MLPYWCITIKEMTVSSIDRAAACGGFAAERPARRRYRSTAGDGAVLQQMRAVSRREPADEEAERSPVVVVVLRRQIVVRRGGDVIASWRRGRTVHTARTATTARSWRSGRRASRPDRASPSPSAEGAATDSWPPTTPVGRGSVHRGRAITGHGCRPPVTLL